MLLIWSGRVGIVRSRGVRVREHVPFVHIIKPGFLRPCPVPWHCRLQILTLQFFFSPEAGDKGKNPWFSVVRGHVRQLWARQTAVLGTEPRLWVKLLLFGLVTWSRAAESGQNGVTSSMAVRGWHVSDRPARCSEGKSHSKTWLENKSQKINLKRFDLASWRKFLLVLHVTSALGFAWRWLPLNS